NRFVDFSRRPKHISPYFAGTNSQLASDLSCMGGKCRKSPTRCNQQRNCRSRIGGLDHSRYNCKPEKWIRGKKSIRSSDANQKTGDNTAGPFRSSESKCRCRTEIST